MLRRSLGPLSVSALALGSWRTWERIPRADAVSTLDEARACGIDFLEVARYDDETGRAPLPTGYSEVVFGEVFRAASWLRDEVTIANKLWWEFWPEQTVASELDASLRRTGLDHFDFIYSDPPPSSLSMEEITAEVSGLVTAGKVRAWGVVNWPAELIAEARAVAPVAPVAAQLPYSLVQRSPVEDPDMVAALGPMGVVASFVLAGGALTGKYPGPGRLSSSLDSPRYGAALREASALQERAAALGTTPAALAIAFALHAPRVACVLLGATSPAQVRENVAALALPPMS